MKAQKEFFINWGVVSILLGILYGAIFAQLDKPEDGISDPENSILFMIYFLLGFGFNTICSLLLLLSSWVAKGVLRNRLLLFTFASLLVTVAAYWLVREFTIFLLLLTPLVLAGLAVKIEQRPN